MLAVFGFIIEILSARSVYAYSVLYVKNDFMRFVAVSPDAAALERHAELVLQRGYPVNRRRGIPAYTVRALISAADTVFSAPFVIDGIGKGKRDRIRPCKIGVCGRLRSVAVYGKDIFYRRSEEIIDRESYGYRRAVAVGFVQTVAARYKLCQAYYILLYFEPDGDRGRAAFIGIFKIIIHRSRSRQRKRCGMIARICLCAVERQRIISAVAALRVAYHRAVTTEPAAYRVSRNLLFAVIDEIVGIRPRYRQRRGRNFVRKFFGIDERVVTRVRAAYNEGKSVVSSYVCAFALLGNRHLCAAIGFGKIVRRYVGSLRRRGVCMRYNAVRRPAVRLNPRKRYFFGRYRKPDGYRARAAFVRIFQRVVIFIAAERKRCGTVARVLARPFERQRIISAVAALLPAYHRAVVAFPAAHRVSRCLLVAVISERRFAPRYGEFGFRYVPGNRNVVVTAARPLVIFLIRNVNGDGITACIRCFYHSAVTRHFVARFVCGRAYRKIDVESAEIVRLLRAAIYAADGRGKFGSVDFRFGYRELYRAACQIIVYVAAAYGKRCGIIARVFLCARKRNFISALRFVVAEPAVDGVSRRLLAAVISKRRFAPLYGERGLLYNEIESNVTRAAVKGIVGRVFKRYGNGMRSGVRPNVAGYAHRFAVIADGIIRLLGSFIDKFALVCRYGQRLGRYPPFERFIRVTSVRPRVVAAYSKGYIIAVRKNVFEIKRYAIAAYGIVRAVAVRVRIRFRDNAACGEYERHFFGVVTRDCQRLTALRINVFAFSVKLGVGGKFFTVYFKVVACGAAFIVIATVYGNFYGIIARFRRVIFAPVLDGKLSRLRIINIFGFSDDFAARRVFEGYVTRKSELAERIETDYLLAERRLNGKRYAVVSVSNVFNDEFVYNFFYLRYRKFEFFSLYAAETLILGNRYFHIIIAYFYGLTYDFV